MDFKFPDVGEGITEGKLVSWHINIGETIKKEQTLASVETDKAVVDIPSPVTGTIEKLNGKPGEVIFVGNVLATINDGTSSINSQTIVPKIQERIQEMRKEIPSQSYQPKPVENIPNYPTNNYSANSNINLSGTVLAMPVVRRAAKIKGINLSNIRGSGKNGQIILSDLNLKLSDVIDVKIDEKVNNSSQALNNIQQATTISNISSSTFNGKDYSSILATPSTKKLARELNVDLTQVKGTGENNSITRDDVLNASKSSSNINSSNSINTNINGFTPSVKVAQAISNIQPSTPSVALQGEKSSNNFGQFEIVKFSPTRNAIYKHMIESKNNTVPFTITDEVDVTELYNFREKYKEHYEKQGVKLTYLPFIIKSIIDAISKHPIINSSVNDINKEIILKKYYNIGIATDTPEGLVVPVVKNSNTKSLLNIANEIAELSKKARDHKLSLDELNGGTFTITSLGNSFGQVFTPVINYPESAILGIGRIVEKPAIINGIIIPRKLITLSLTCDHRIIDGAEASRFMNDVKWNIENFETMLIN